MNERDYLVGYKEALEELSRFITQATRRYPNNPMAVLNDIIVKVHQELANKRIALYDMEDFTVILDEKEIEEINKAVDDLIKTFTQPIFFTVEKVKKEDN